MNNMKYYNDSLAYDFEMFAPKPAKTERNNIVVMPKRNKNHARRRKSAVKAVSAPALMIMSFIIVLAGLCGNIALRLQINEVNAEINKVNAAIAELDSEKTELESEIQRRISYANLELEATELGMKKPDKDDVIYIRVNEKDAAKIADGSLLESE